MSLFSVLKKEPDARSCFKKCWMWRYFKKHWKRWRLLGLGQMSIDNIFKPGTGIAGPMIYLDQDHISSLTTSLWKCWCVGISLLQESTAKFCLLLTHSLFFASFYQGNAALPLQCCILASSDKQLQGSEGKTETIQKTGSWGHLVLKNSLENPGVTCWCLTLWEGSHFPRWEDKHVGTALPP